MKIPAYIEKALEQRAKCAARLNRVNSVIDDFLIKHGINEELDTYDYGFGSEVVTAPYDSAERVRIAIRKHKNG